jgi:hypothetical protein
MSRRTIGVLVTFAVVVAACGSGGAAETTTTVRENPQIVVTYDGTGCVYDGPETMTTGAAGVTFINETDSEVWLGWWLLNDDVEYDTFAQQNNPTQGLPKGMIDEEMLWFQAPSGEKTRGNRAESGTTAFACVLHVGSGVGARVTEVWNFISLEVTP